jgi:hypothetical protein
MGNAPRLVYSPRPDATPETELSVLAAYYRYLLDAHANTHSSGSWTPAMA